MRKLILSELIILFFATAFTGNPPQGWYLQVLPRTDVTITGISFLDSLKGWAVAKINTNDSGLVIITTNGGNNWNVQQKGDYLPYALQMLSASIGYIVGLGLDGSCSFHKTTDGGVQWTRLNVLSGVGMLNNLFFINKDTGWVCSSEDFFDGGVFKTTDGGMNWTRQLDPNTKPNCLFFLNSDTGWVGNKDIHGKLYRTTNSGVNWDLQYTFPQQVNDIYFFNAIRGVVSSGFSSYTTNGGANWIQTNDGGIKLSFADDSVGWAGNNFIEIIKTTTGGRTWFRQTTNASNPSVSAFDSLKAWAGGGSKIVHTIDGGPISAIQTNTEIPSKYILKQNYPNPFNPTTTINYELRVTNYVTLKIYDLQGREVSTLVNENQTAGSYSVDFDSNQFNLSSGIYFYSLEAKDFRDTKKMILIK